jgi:hypothetical protein
MALDGVSDPSILAVALLLDPADVLLLLVTTRKTAAVSAALPKTSFWSAAHR